MRDEQPTETRSRLRRHLALVLFTAMMLSGVPAMALSLPLPATIGVYLEELIEEEVPGIHLAAVSLDSIAGPVLVASLESVGLEVVAFEHFPAAVVAGTTTALAALEFVPGVTGAWLDRQLDQVDVESRALIGADTVNQTMALDGTGVGVAVIDSGIEATHLDLEFGTKTVQNVKVVGVQGPEYSGPLTALAVPIENLPDTDLVTGHGTHVAGIVAGNGARSNGRIVGVAPGAHLVGVGVGDAYLVTTLAGYDWLLENHEEYGVRVLNNSWADSGIAYDDDHPLNLASKAAYDAGIVVIQAAGNEGQASGDVFNRYAAPDWVLAVGGVDKLGRLGDYSSRGTEENHADVVAPGSFIASTMAVTGLYGAPNQTPFDLTEPTAPRVLEPAEIPFYTVKVGTSMAAPHVAGIAALMLQANPALTPQQVYDILRDTARPVPSCLAIDCGEGLVDAVAAVAAAELVTAPTLLAPVASLAASVTVGQAPLQTTLDGTGSTDADGSIVSYEWDLDGDATTDVTTTTPTLSHTFEAGRHNVALVVVDDDGMRSLAAVTQVRASDPPVAAASAPTKAKSGEAVTIDASGSTDPDGAVVSYTFDLGDGTVVTQATPVLSYAWTAEKPDRFVWVVTVTDDAGLVDTVSSTIKITPGGNGA